MIARPHLEPVIGVFRTGKTPHDDTAAIELDRFLPADQHRGRRACGGIGQGLVAAVKYPVKSGREMLNRQHAVEIGRHLRKPRGRVRPQFLVGIDQHVEPERIDRRRHTMTGQVEHQKAEPVLVDFERFPEVTAELV